MSVVLPNFTGSTQLNPYITTYEKLIKRVKHTLGFPLVNIEISDEQIVDFINESIEYFTKYAGYTEEYLVFDTRIYKPHTGLQVEKLINSTSTYGLDQSAVNVVDLAAGLYYFSGSSVYITVSGEAEQVSLNRSYQGPLLYQNVILQQSYTYSLSTATVNVTPYTYYIENSSLYISGSAFSLDPSLSLSGTHIQTPILQRLPELLEQHFDAPYLVPVKENTYYVHSTGVYIAGTSTDEMLEGTSNIGTLVGNVTLSPLFSTYEIDSTASVVQDVPTDTFYVSQSRLFKSSNYAHNNQTYTGVEAQSAIQELTFETKFITREDDVVDTPANSFYIHDSSLWLAGVSASTTTSLKGHRSNIALLEVLPDTFTINGVEVHAVPVPPNTVYFCGDILYRSGDAIELENGYSELGDIVQTEVFAKLIYRTTVSTDMEVISCTPDTYYIYQGDLWKSGQQIDETYSDIGVLISEEVVVDPLIEIIDVKDIVDIVKLPAESYYIKDGNLMQSTECCDTVVPLGYSDLGCVVVEEIPIIINLLQGTPLCEEISCIKLPPLTFYLFGGALCRSGVQSPFPEYSYSGNVVQQVITNNIIDVFVADYNIVNVPPQTFYISNGRLYCSGESTNYLVNGSSDIGTLIINNVAVNPKITQESMPCLNMYYDYDMSTYRKVIDVFTFEQGESTGINTLFTLEQAMAQQIYSSYMIGNFGFDLVTWEVLKGFIDTRNKVLAQKPHFRFDNRTQTLRIIPEPRAEESYLGLVGCYLERPLKDLVQERWVYDYTKALAMIAVGNTRGKYSGTGLFGGGNVNAADVRQQGLTEKDVLEKRLMTEYIDNNPPNFFVG